MRYDSMICLGFTLLLTWCSNWEWKIQGQWQEKVEIILQVIGLICILCLKCGLWHPKTICFETSRFQTVILNLFFSKLQTIFFRNPTTYAWVVLFFVWNLDNHLFVFQTNQDLGHPDLGHPDLGHLLYKPMLPCTSSHSFFITKMAHCCSLYTW